MHVLRWLLTAHARHLPPEAFIEAFAERLHEAGFPVSRLVFTLRTMHPEVWLVSVRWSREDGGYVLRRDHMFDADPLFQESPVGRMYRGEPGFRCRLQAPLPANSFPILHERKEAGDTDYLIAPLELQPGFYSYVSCSTDAPDGFSDAACALWEDLLLPLGATLADMSNRTALDSLLQTYLGAQAANHVQLGHFKRGDGDAIEAVIWFSDLRGFTHFTDIHTATEVIARLNCYFDLVGAALANHGGEILKFIGDGILAVFPLSAATDGARAANAALTAAREVLAACKAPENATSAHPLDVGIGLHIGQVTFGNVGTKSRLDFTVIGGPVNEAARVEALCKSLGVSLLLTEPVATLANDPTLVSAGTHALRGARTPRTLFTVPA